ncbi:Mbov_0401 family ICE element transposase-like protein [Mycoplasma sp. VS299A]|uniref:Mbov_0401 family ICE element transposase-like protein n=1 Tax=Mycoplasma sp. VS299A TaxID=3401690 RepID=UPI003AAE67EF
MKKLINIAQVQMQQFVDTLNNKEKEFREKIRKHKFPTWNICRRKQKKFITKYGTFFLNITMYETRINRKVKRFTYYHDDIMKQIMKYKYDYELMNDLCFKYLNGENIGSINGKRISANHIKYWIKLLGIDKNIEEENNRLIDEIKSKKLNDCNSDIDIEIDDTYNGVNSKISSRKHCFRQAVIHSKRNNKIGKNGVVMLMLLGDKEKEKNSKTNGKKINDFQNHILKNIEDFTFKGTELFLKADGAKWIKNIANNIKANYVLDLFHLKFVTKKAIGYTKHSNNPYKNFFKNWYSKTFNARWYDLFEYVFEYKTLQDCDSLMNIFMAEFDELKCENNELKAHIRAFIKYIDNNKKGIWNLDGYRIKRACYTEHFVYAKCKKHIKRPQALYGYEAIKLRIMYGNLKAGYCTLFY